MAGTLQGIPGPVSEAVGTILVQAGKISVISAANLPIPKGQPTAAILKPWKKY